jgi:two-component sensor histidine kinase
MNATHEDPKVATCIDGMLAGGIQGADVRLAPFLRGITNEILGRSVPGDRTSLTHSHPADSTISAAQARPVGLIVGELVTNAVSYAHPSGIPGRINVSSGAGAAAGDYSIKVSDDGVGLPERFDPEVDGGAGLKAVRSLAGRLGARLQFSDDGVGLSVRLDVPAPPARPSPKALI